MLDLDLVTGDGPERVFSLLRDARGALLDLGRPGPSSPVRDSDRIQIVASRYDGEWELPVVGKVEAPTAMLVRPDGYVALVGNGDDDGLHDALTTWFGPRWRGRLVASWSVNPAEAGPQRRGTDSTHAGATPRCENADDSTGGSPWKVRRS